jgi:ATP-binding cassette subfamily B protein
VVIGSIYFSRKAREAFRVLRIKIAEINTRFSETIGGVRVIQLFRRERQNYESFAKLNHENYEAGMDQIRILGVFMPFIEFMGVLAIALVIYFGGRGVLADEISLGSLAAFISYMKMFFRPIRDIADKYNLLQNAMASAERIFLILDNKENDAATVNDQNSISNAEKMPFAGKEPEIGKIKSIEFKNVNFGYIPGEPVLKNLSFKIEAGQKIAIVGPTGSGKTTLINLIPRFYDAETGDILLNGRSIRHTPTNALRSKMALVTQDPFLFSQSIQENIFSGKNHLPREKINQILSASNCERMINRLPNGVTTVLSEGGASISSGERQLISIARAFARDPELIILDEATSYVDSETEEQIQEAINALMKDRTAIIVAHRLTTARSADHIIVLNHGRIIESGNHEQLMMRGGFYYTLNQLGS